ncbi:hypothetical protein BpHYR1_013045 [Brachionus plicatilis]|uniref:Uncharacterized protein n=1 Tax=Brachionus plicatilis TaxID=10195 RepID=A0A3M7RYU0_BRAPC|nr:hypothetical protein BpHYR1_013045 [Brachionus plicatilis]
MYSSGSCYQEVLTELFGAKSIFGVIYLNYEANRLKKSYILLEIGLINYPKKTFLIHGKPLAFIIGKKTREKKSLLKHNSNAIINDSTSHQKNSLKSPFSHSTQTFARNMGIFCMKFHNARNMHNLFEFFIMKNPKIHFDLLGFIIWGTLKINVFYID